MLRTIVIHILLVNEKIKRITTVNLFFYFFREIERRLFYVFKTHWNDVRKTFAAVKNPFERI